MPVAAIVSFVVVFALILMAVSVALKFFDERRKKQMAGMLETASGEPVMAISNLLKEIETDKPGGARQLLKSLHLSRYAQDQIQQAGLNWPATRLLAAMGLLLIPGLGLGALLPFLMNRFITMVVLGDRFLAALPYLYGGTSAKSAWTTWKSSSPRRSTFWPAPCAPATPSPSAWGCLARNWPIPWARKFRSLFNEQKSGRVAR